MECLAGLLASPAIGCVIGLLMAIFLFPFYFLWDTSRRDHKWEAWEEEHAWPLGEHAYIVTDRFIRAQKKLGREASPQAFQHYITEESGEEFPIELCQTLLTTVAMQLMGLAMPPKVDEGGAIERMPKAEPFRVGNEVAIEKIAKAESPTVGQEQPQVRVRKGSPVITDVDKLIAFGQMALDQGWYAQARDYFEQALALDASNREAMKGLARVYERLSHRGADDD
jgi:hypothetical protein